VFEPDRADAVGNNHAATQQGLDDEISVDGVDNRLANLF
jgi:hypothetical protein